MISKKRFRAELSIIETNINLSPPDFKAYWHYYKKGFESWYYHTLYEERRLHSTRMSWVNSPSSEERIRGNGYSAGYNAGKAMEQSGKRGRNEIGRQLNPLSCPEWLENNLKKVAAHYGVSVASVRRAAYSWYCQAVIKEIEEG